MSISQHLFSIVRKLLILPPQMLTHSFSRLLLATLLLAAAPLAAQQRAPSRALTEADQELDGFSGGYASIHRISARLRGVRGADSTLYWVSPDGRRLTAYKRGQQLWQADLTKAFATILLGALIDRLVFSSNVIFVFTAKGGHAEVNRATGEVSAIGLDKE
jgi:hypothetical protein